MNRREILTSLPASLLSAAIGGNETHTSDAERVLNELKAATENYRNFNEGISSGLYTLPPSIGLRVPGNTGERLRENGDSVQWHKREAICNIEQIQETYGLTVKTKLWNGTEISTYYDGMGMDFYKMQLANGNGLPYFYRPYGVQVHAPAGEKSLFKQLDKAEFVLSRWEMHTGADPVYALSTAVNFPAARQFVEYWFRGFGPGDNITIAYNAERFEIDMIGQTMRYDLEESLIGEQLRQPTDYSNVVVQYLGAEEFFEDNEKVCQIIGREETGGDGEPHFFQHYGPVMYALIPDKAADGLRRYDNYLVDGAIALEGISLAAYGDINVGDGFYTVGEPVMKVRLFNPEIRSYSYLPEEKKA